MKPSGSVVEGTLVDAFEAEFAELVGGRPCVAVDERGSALAVTLRALGIGPGDEVIVASYGPAGSAHAVQLVGATPVFADIDAHTFCLDPQAVSAAVGPRTAAILAAHRFGHPAAMGALEAVADRHGLVLLEDASEAANAAIDGRPVGTFGTAAVFGPCVVTADTGLAQALRQARTGETLPGEEWAAERRAAIEGIAGVTARRRAHARILDSALKGVLVPYVQPGAWHVYGSYTVRVPGNGRPDRDAFARALAARGVRASVPVVTPVHRRPEHRSTVHLPRTEEAAAHTLCLPVEPLLTGREVERVVAACNALGGLL